MHLTVVIPFFNGNAYLQRLLDTLPPQFPVVLVNDQSEENPLLDERSNLTVLNLERKGYFTGAVNAGIRSCTTDVLVLNQDVYFTGSDWVALLEKHRSQYAMIGERIRGEHPTFGKTGYVHGTFMYLRRDALDRVGLLNEVEYPLWGSTAEWHLRAARLGFEILPLSTIPDFVHERGEQPFGSSISDLLEKKPHLRNRFIRTPPKVSVVVPCYRYGRYISDCIHSLIGGPTSLGDMPGQTLQSLEIVVVDDASPDDSWDFIEPLLDERKGIRGYQLDKNRGTAEALNFAIEKSVGEYITFLSADDMREPNSLEKLVQACESHPHHFAYDHVTLFGGGRRGKPWRIESYDFDKLLYKNTIHAGILYPRQAWVEAGGYPSAMRDGREDWAFNVALGIKGWCGVRVDNYGYLYRREGQNRSLTNTTEFHRNIFIQRIRERFPEVYEGRRPVGCCGGGSRSRSTAPSMQSQVRRGQRVMAQNEPVPGSKGMVRLRYLGDQMSSIWTGNVSHVRYRFGKDRPVAYVDARDVGERARGGFMALRGRDGEFLFAVEEVKSKPETKAAENVTPPTEDTVAVVETPADAVESNTEPVAADPPKSSVRNPGDFTISEVQGWDLDAEGWREVYSQELAGRNRRGLIDFLEGKLAGE